MLMKFISGELPDRFDLAAAGVLFFGSGIEAGRSFGVPDGAIDFVSPNDDGSVYRDRHWLCVSCCRPEPNSSTCWPFASLEPVCRDCNAMLQCARERAGISPWLHGLAPMPSFKRFRQEDAR